MTVKTMSSSVVLDLAERFGVTVHWVANEAAIPEPFRSPSSAHGCDPSKRAVYFCDSPNYFESIEHYFHELVHVIVQAPFWTLEDVPEELVLMQYERALANALFEPWAYDLVVAWQEETVVLNGQDRFLGGITDYEKAPFWQLGYAIARRIDLLNRSNRPTFRWPSWDRLTKTEIEAIDEFYCDPTNAPTPRIGDHP